MKPVIGIFAKIDNEAKQSLLKYEYAEAVELSGGLPVLLPYVKEEECIEQFVNLCDGFLFSGGVDVSPKLYGEEVKSTCGVIEPYRDELEYRLMDKVLKTGKPIMAICRGVQLINVYFGGTLYQDIPTEYETNINHRQPPKDRFVITHDIIVKDGTPLMDLVNKERISGNTFHHQSIKTLGKGLELMATADDGIVESIFMPSHTYLRGYQWHPERLVKFDESNKKIFDSFISACKK